jgi:membrane protease YdiL (CAAX protease family)
MFLLISGLGFLFSELGLVSHQAGFTPRNLFFNELLSVIGLSGAVGILALVEQRHVLDYNLREARGIRHFLSGLAAGFAALSLLVACLASGGWLHIGGATLSGMAAVKFGLIWAGVFLLVGLFEEGTFRCYLQATLERGINFWWALGAVALICAILVVRHRGNGVWGDYALALLGLLPCLWMELRRAEGRGFWQAAWVTSTLFGFVHTGNGGESWIGIFAAGAIGFVFCVSIRLTGSAWWAIGTHAGWDWGETYFYGTPDSGMVAPGHFLSTTVSGNVLWSGGGAGPEGSLLVLAVILLMLFWLLAVYGKKGNQRVGNVASSL